MERKLLDMMNQLFISEYNSRMEYGNQLQFVCMINLNSILATYLEWGQKVPPLSLFMGEKRHRDSKMVPFCTSVF